MLQEIPLSDEERAAVDGDVEALNRLLERLQDVPVPSHASAGSQHALIPVNTIRPVHQTP